jgi:HEAT repeat protein
MVTKNGRPRGQRVIGALLCLLLTAPAITCGFQSTRQIEANIERLRNAQDRLEKNPRDTEALSLILSLLRDRNGINRANAAAVLGQTGERVGAQIKDDAVPQLIDLLETGDEFDRHAASGALRDFGPHAKAAIPALLKALKDGNTSTALHSAEALGRMGDEGKVAIPSLIEALNVYEIGKLEPGQGLMPQLAFEAADALAKFGPDAKQAVPALKEKLEHPNGQFKIHLAQAIRQIDPNDAESLQVLITLLQHREIYIQRDALMALGDLGKNARPAIPAIKGYLQNKPGEEEREYATNALKRIEGNDQGETKPN